MTLWSRQHALPAARVVVMAGLVATMFSLSGITFAHEADGHPARIHEGTCEELGPVTDQLTGVGATINPGGTPIPTPETVGSEAAFPIVVSMTELETEVSELTDTPHAIVVYESDQAMETILVCGTVGGALLMQMPGMPMPGDELAIWLAPQDDVDYTGAALLQSEVGGTSSLTIFLAQGLSGGLSPDDEHAHVATPEATPTSG
jgi:hypothetical protein